MGAASPQVRQAAARYQGAVDTLRSTLAAIARIGQEPEPVAEPELVPK